MGGDNNGVAGVVTSGPRVVNMDEDDWPPGDGDDELSSSVVSGGAEEEEIADEGDERSHGPGENERSHGPSTAEAGVSIDLVQV